MEGKDQILLKPVKTKSKPKWTIDEDGNKCLEISNWHWRKYFDNHTPLRDWEVEELKMTPEEASEEIKKWDRNS